MAAKKSLPAKTPAKSIAKPIEKVPVAPVSTPIRNTPIPKVASPVAKQVTREQIAVRAFEIFASGKGGSESDNWHRAERELRGL